MCARHCFRRWRNCRERKIKSPAILGLTVEKDRQKQVSNLYVRLWCVFKQETEHKIEANGLKDGMSFYNRLGKEESLRRWHFHRDLKELSNQVTLTFGESAIQAEGKTKILIRTARPANCFTAAFLFIAITEVNILIWGNWFPKTVSCGPKV